MKNLSNVEKSAFRRGEYIGHLDGAQRITRNGKEWMMLGQSFDTLEAVNAHCVKFNGLTVLKTAYIECALWCGGEEIEASDAGINELAPSLSAQMQYDCHKFMAQASELIGGTHFSQAGHDFWLTRNGHGAGFWDRPEIWGDNAQKLTEIAQKFGEVNLYIGDDGLIYSE